MVWYRGGLVINCLMVLALCHQSNSKPAKNVKVIPQKKLKTTENDKSKLPDAWISFSNPKQQWCTRIDLTLRMKTMAQKRIETAVTRVQLDKSITPEEKNFHLDRFVILEKELNETEQQIMDSFNWLNDVLRGDYKDVINMKTTSKNRLDALRDATVKEEQEYSAILKAEEKMKQFNQSKVEGMLAEIMRNVADAADKLEADLSNHVFDNAMLNSNLAKGANIEAVIRLEDDDKAGKPEPTGTNSSNAKPKREGSGVMKLVDAQDNQFVLSRGKDTTVPHEDEHFIKDVVYLVLLSFLCGLLCTLIGLPSMFGYIIGGIILGPSGFNILKSLVQLETLGEFGVFFILFSVGLEFSPDKIKKVAKVAMLGTSAMMLLMILGGLGLGAALKASPGESMFVAACLSLSSTPLVVRFLSPASDSQSGEGTGCTEYGMVLLGVLIMQDVLLGVLMAVLPSLAANTESSSVGTQALTYLLLALRLIGSLLALVMVSFIVARFLLKYIFNHFLSRGNKEMTVLASVALAFTVLLATDTLQVSMELGCFVAGVMISAQGPTISSQIEQLIQPVKDFLSVLFFASIGLHIFPSFMVYELTYLMTFTILTVTAKFVISVVVIAVLLPRSPRHIKWLVAAGLAQVSEFSFVLGSRARRLGLISREVYLLILSVTTLSLLMAPLLWKLSLWQQRIKQNSRHKSKAEDCKSSLTYDACGDTLQTSLTDDGHMCTCDWNNSKCHGYHGKPASQNGSLCNLLTNDEFSGQYGSYGNLIHRHHGTHFGDLTMPGVHHSHENLLENRVTGSDFSSTPVLDLRRGSY